MQLYLVRHPPPAVAAGICYGHTDLPLAADPASSAVRLRAQLPAGLPVFSSPLQRCRLFAEALHPTPIVDDRLRELDFGDWEMRPWDSIDRALLDVWAEDPLLFAPPGGESVSAMRERVSSFLDSLAADAILVTHGGVMKICACLLAGISSEDWLGLRFDYGSVAMIAAGRLTIFRLPA